MAIIRNQILIQAPVEKVWEVLASPELLGRYDPTVRKSSLMSEAKSNIRAKRRVDMSDGKNWFEEEITVYKPNEALTYELTACSFPIHKLKHTYSFHRLGQQTEVSQVMEYTLNLACLVDSSKPWWSGSSPMQVSKNSWQLLRRSPKSYEHWHTTKIGRRNWQHFRHDSWHNGSWILRGASVSLRMCRIQSGVWNVNK